MKNCSKANWKKIKQERPDEYDEYMKTRRHIQRIKFYRWAYPAGVFLLLIALVLARVPFWVNFILAGTSIFFGIRNNRKWNHRKKVLDIVFLLLEFTLHTKEPGDEPQLMDELGILLKDE